MIEQVRLHAERIRDYETKFGPEVVEDFLDCVLSIEEHFDPTATVFRRKSHEEHEQDRLHAGDIPQGRYDDLWNLSGTTEKQKPKAKKFPEEPEKDLLRFLIEYSPELADWQRDILEIVREEMIYFLPQMRTKIMNEGWASFWHERILESLDLTSEEHWEFRRLHSSVLSPGSKMQMNPYYVGFQILKDIKRRWDGEVDSSDTPEEDWMGRAVKRPEGQGLAKMFEVIEQDNDVTFLRQYLTENLVKKLDLYTYKQKEIDGENMWVVQDTDWRKVRDTLVNSMTNFGQPILLVDDADYHRHGELYIRHAYDGQQLDVQYAKRTLRNVHRLWGRPVHLETVVDKDKSLLSYDGDDFELEVV
jgi:stage V sporulation protein R